MVDSTGLRARVGEERAELVRREHEQAAALAVGRSGGTVVKSLGDGVMATFLGAADAVSAAVGVQQATERTNRTSASEPVGVRIGLAAGDVTWEKDDCFGMPVVEAARLCASAEAGQIVASGTVRALAGSRGGHTYTDLGLRELKGIPDPVTAFRVGWSAAGMVALPLPTALAVRGTELPFVGRERELQVVLGAWRAGGGSARLLALAGEPGMGKTRLAAEAARALCAEGVPVLFGRCDEQAAAPYQPFVDAMRHFLRNVDDAELLETLGRNIAELTRILPELAGRLDGEEVDTDADVDQFRLYEAVSGWLGALSERAPVLLVIDDVHWAGPPTLRLLGHILRSVEPARLLILATYRDSEVDEDHPLRDVLAEARRQDLLTAIDLGGLDVSAVDALLSGSDLSGRGGSAEAIQRATRGNAFFVGEVLRAARDHIGSEDGSALLAGIGVPDGVKEVVSRRIARFDSRTRQLLGVASLVGLEFDLSVVARAAGEDEAEAAAALDEAVARRVLEEAGAPGRVGYRFAHDLVRQTLEAGLSTARRTLLHAAIGAAIEEEFGDDLLGHAVELARHYSLAARSSAQKALHFAVLAAERADASLAHDHASAAYQLGLDVFAAAGSPGGTRRRLELLVALGTAQRRAGDPAHRETLLAAGRQAGEAGEAGIQARAALANNRGYASTVGAVDHERVEALERALAAIGIEETPMRARLLAVLAVELTFSPADWDRRRELSDEALSIARRISDLETLSHVLSLRHETIWHVSTTRERLADTAEHMDLADGLGDPHQLFRAAYNGFWASMGGGDFAEADARLGGMTMLAGDLMEPGLRWQAGVSRAARLITQGRLADAQSAADEALEHGLAAHEPDAPAYHGGQSGYILGLKGHFGLVADGVAALALDNPGLTILHEFASYALFEAGRYDEAREWIARLGRGGFSDRPYNEDWMSGMYMVAMTVFGLRDAEHAALIEPLVLPYADCFDTNGGTWLPSGHGAVAAVQATLEKWDEADEHFARAVSADEKVGVEITTVLTRYNWASSLLARARPGDKEKARSLLGRAAELCAAYDLSGIGERVGALAADRL